MKLTDGVYFRQEDYASFWLRLLIGLIDVLATGTFCLVLGIVLWAAMPPTRMTLNLILAVLAAILFCYMVVLKRSKIGTIGYRLCGVRIVGQDGQAASVPALTFRLLFAPLGPLNWFMDVLWLSGDPHRQSLRDKLAHTYVVKRNAHPAGKGRIIHNYYDIFGYSFVFQEIESTATQAVSE